jgi:hypothetical protein
MFIAASYETDGKDAEATLYFAREALRLSSMDVSIFCRGRLLWTLSWMAISLRADASDIGCVACL